MTDMGNAGVFITFEGIDGAGKSTHMEVLADHLRRGGRTVTITREPGGTQLAEKVRSLVLNEPMEVLTEALLVFAARRDHLIQVIEPALRRGEVVLCDRFTDSSFAYQGAGLGLDQGFLETLERWTQTVVGPSGSSLRQPDLTLWFDLPIADAAERLSQARAPDKFEAKGPAFYSRVAQGYALRARDFPERICRVRADREKTLVWLDIEQAVRARGWLP